MYIKKTSIPTDHTKISGFISKLKMVGHQLSHELEINVLANQAWELFSTLRLAKLIEEEFKDLFQKIEILEGDGGPGTLVKLYFCPWYISTHYFPCLKIN